MISINRVVFYCYLMFFISISIMGNLDQILLYNFPLRKVFYIIFLVSLLLFYVTENKFKISFFDLNVFLFSICFFIIFSLCIPFFKNVPLSNSISEILPYSIPLLSVIAIKCFTFDFNLKIQNKFSICLVILGLLHVIFVFVYLFDVNLGNKVYVALNYYFNDINITNDATPDLVNYFIFPRIQFGISTLLFLYFYIKFREYILADRKYSIYFFKICLSLFFIIITQSRALIFSSFLIPIIYYLNMYILRSVNNIISRNILFCCMIFLPLAISLIIIDSHSMELLGISRNIGDDIRVIQVTSLFDKWLEYPYLGFALGGHADVIRNIDNPWLYEVSITAILLKLGIIGSGFIFLLIIFIVTHINKLNNNYFDKVNIKLYSLALSSIFCFLLASNTNPYLNNFVGGVILLSLFIDAGVICKSQTNIRNKINNYGENDERC